MHSLHPYSCRQNDEDRIVEHFEQELQKAERGEEGGGPQEGKKTMRGSVKPIKVYQTPPVERDIPGLRYSILPWNNPA